LYTIKHWRDKGFPVTGVGWAFSTLPAIGPIELLLEETCLVALARTFLFDLLLLLEGARKWLRGVDCVKS